MSSRPLASDAIVEGSAIGRLPVVDSNVPCPLYDEFVEVPLFDSKSALDSNSTSSSSQVTTAGAVVVPAPLVRSGRGSRSLWPPTQSSQHGAAPPIVVVICAADEHDSNVSNRSNGGDHARADDATKPSSAPLGWSSSACLCRPRSPSSSSPSRSRTNVAPLAWALCCSLLLFGTFALLHYLSQLRMTHAASLASSPHVRAPPARTTFSSALAAEIDRVRNASADPCVDFFEYACGSWLERTAIPSDQAQWTRSFSTIAERNRAYLLAIANDSWPLIRPLYRSCMDEQSAQERWLATLSPWLRELAELDTAFANDTTSTQCANVTTVSLAMPNGDGATASNNPPCNRSIDSLMSLFGRMQRELGVTPLFSIDVAVNDREPSMQWISLRQGGLTLRTTAHYLGPHNRTARFEQHIARILRLSGLEANETVAARDAHEIVAWETEVARLTINPAQLRDPWAVYNPFNLSALEWRYPNLSWSAYFSALGVLPSATVNGTTVDAPAFFDALHALVSRTPSELLVRLARWRLLHSFGSDLPGALADEYFEFFGRELAGLRAPVPRWHKCVDVTVANLGELIGRIYLEQHFDRSNTEHALAMIRRVKAALNETLPTYEWMDCATAHAALAKLSMVEDLIAGPTTWTDYSTLQLSSTEFLRNLLVLRRFRHALLWRRLNETSNKHRWQMPASEVNAYYDPTYNTINFPAGILQAPFFDASFPDAMNMAGIGLVMGHEIVHGFDDQGRLYDGTGRLRSWWTNNSQQAFTERARCFVEQYDRFEVVRATNRSATSSPLRGEPNDTHSTGEFVNGQLTLGENIADNGGLHLSWLAYRALQNATCAMSNSTLLEASPPRNGTDSFDDEDDGDDEDNEATSAGGQRARVLSDSSSDTCRSAYPTIPTTPPLRSHDQLFFLSFAQAWCQKMRPEHARSFVLTDVHSPGFARVNGPLANFAPFADAFECPLGTPMNPRHKCALY